MVQKEPKKRGRPRAYEPDAALMQAMAAFWERGYAATSLDDLVAATGMNRPSLYAAFGDKRAIYVKALERYGAGRGLREALASEPTLRGALRRAFGTAIDVYLPAEKPARGCFVIGTAVTEAMHEPVVREVLSGVLRDLDEGFEERIRAAIAEGALPSDADPAASAKIASAALLSLAVRSRSGESRAELEKTAEAAVAMICGGSASTDSAGGPAPAIGTATRSAEL
jgi:AcrR family transcriptional regulator